MRSPAPAYDISLNDATIEAARAALGPMLDEVRERVFEVQLFVRRDHRSFGIVDEAHGTGVCSYSQSNAPFFQA